MVNEKNIESEIEDYSPNILDFTRRSEDYFYDTVDLKDFKDKEADFIYDCLYKRLRLIPFCDYLKRYIFIKSGMTGDYREVALREYQEIIVESFRENHTPASFHETTSKLSALTKNWLTQESVKRQVVFLLGFGLNMSVDDVSSFLLKAQKERDFNFKDSMEIIYWYCFKNKLKFPQMLKLREVYESLPSNNSNDVYYDKTMDIREKFRSIAEDQILLRYLADLKTDNQKYSYSITSYKWFFDLYLKCREIIAGYYNDEESYTEQTKKSKKIWTADDITEGDVEKILCCGTPIDDSGNLLKVSVSTLSKHFINKRLSRQHLGEVINKKIQVDRFDLITLNFFVFSHDDSYTNNQRRFNAFIDGTNEILNECSMGELYIANPYECFLLMCTVSDAPFPTYSEVLEKSFDE